MRFYQALQLSPLALKNQIKAANTKKEKHFFQKAIVTRSFLLVSFAIVFISLITSLFGNETSSLAVVLFCQLLSLRFIDFGYQTKQALIGLGIVSAILLFSPPIAFVLPIGFQFVWHFASLILLFFLTSSDERLGNPSLYSFSYLFLVGTLPGSTTIAKRSVLMLIAYLFLAVIYYVKHRGKHSTTTFKNRVIGQGLWSKTNRFLVTLAFSLSLFLLLMAIFPLERFMWAGFACASLLAGQRNDWKQKAWDRLIGVCLGTALFVVLYQLIPHSFHSLLGPIAGFCLGFCGSYRYQTVFNGIGALLLAQSIYGVEQAAYLRIFDNLVGVLFAFVCLLAITLSKKLIVQKDKYLPEGNYSENKESL